MTTWFNQRYTPGFCASCCTTKCKNRDHFRIGDWVRDKIGYNPKRFIGRIQSIALKIDSGDFVFVYVDFYYLTAPKKNEPRTVSRVRTVHEIARVLDAEVMEYALSGYLEIYD